MARETSRSWSKILVALVPFTIGAQAIHWFTLPASASASKARWWAVAAQALLGIGAGCWLLLRARSARRDN
jgi:hypothetical protein